MSLHTQTSAIFAYPEDGILHITLGIDPTAITGELVFKVTPWNLQTTDEQPGRRFDEKLVNLSAVTNSLR